MIHQHDKSTECQLLTGGEVVAERQVLEAVKQLLRKLRHRGAQLRGLGGRRLCQDAAVAHAQYDRLPAQQRWQTAISLANAQRMIKALVQHQRLPSLPVVHHSAFIEASPYSGLFSGTNKRC